MKVEKLAKNGEMGQNCYPLSPGLTPQEAARSCGRGLAEKPPPPDAPEEDADDRTGPTPSSTCDLIFSRLRRIASMFLLNLASCDFFRGGMMAFRSAQTCAVRVRVHGRLDFP